MNIHCRHIDEAANGKAQLLIRGGKLIASDGTEPDFSEFKDMDCALVNHKFLREIEDLWFMVSNWGA